MEVPASAGERRRGDGTAARPRGRHGARADAGPPRRGARLRQLGRVRGSAHLAVSPHRRRAAPRSGIDPRRAGRADAGSAPVPRPRRLLAEERAAGAGGPVAGRLRGRPLRRPHVRRGVPGLPPAPQGGPPPFRAQAAASRVGRLPRRLPEWGRRSGAAGLPALAGAADRCAAARPRRRQVARRVLDARGRATVRTLASEWLSDPPRGLDSLWNGLDAALA